MEEKIKELLNGPLGKMDILVDSVSYEKEGSHKIMRIIIDKASIIDLDTVVEATHIINKLLDESNIIDERFILDVSSKEKGSN